MFAFFVCRTISTLWLGLNIRRFNLLPKKGPAIIIANHNSHLDTIVLLSLFCLRNISKVKVAAASDYFMKNTVMRFISVNFIGIVPVKRSAKAGNPLKGCFETLSRGGMLIIFPEGTRGEPEIMEEIKGGIGLLASKNPDTVVSTVYMAGLGKSLPKGTWIPIPVIVDIFVDTPIYYKEFSQREDFITHIDSRFKSLIQEHGRNLIS